MIIYSKTRYIPSDVNMMVIEDENGGYFYIHRMLYDQAVILEDLYGSKLGDLAQIIVGTGKIADRVDVDMFAHDAPVPIRSLAPFLMLCPEPFETIEDCAGALHVMSGPINFRRMVNVPIEIRNNAMTFSMSIKDEYKLAWDRFFKTAIPYREDMFTSAAAPMMGTATVTQPAEEEIEEVEEEATPLEDMIEYEGRYIDPKALEALESDTIDMDDIAAKMAAAQAALEAEEADESENDKKDETEETPTDGEVSKEDIEAMASEPGKEGLSALADIM